MIVAIENLVILIGLIYFGAIIYSIFKLILNIEEKSII